MVRPHSVPLESAQHPQAARVSPLRGRHLRPPSASILLPTPSAELTFAPRSQPVAGVFQCQVRKIDLVEHERVWRQVLREWAVVEARLLEECRDRFRGDDD